LTTKKSTSKMGNIAWSTFHTSILKTGKNTTGIKVSEELLDQLGAGRRPLIYVRIKEHTYRTSVGSMKGTPMIPVSAANRKAAGVEGGEEVEVSVRLDLDPRTVELPEDLKTAIEKAGALEAFETTAPSMKKEYVRQVTEAKALETRERRIKKIVEKLQGK
jgi:hypothetical protein